MTTEMLVFTLTHITEINERTEIDTTVHETLTHAMLAMAEHTDHAAMEFTSSPDKSDSYRFESSNGTYQIDTCLMTMI